MKNDIGTLERALGRLAPRRGPGADALDGVPRARPRERIDELRALDDDGFAADSWTPDGPGHRAPTCCRFRIFDSWVHEQDMRRAVERPGRPRLAGGRATRSELMIGAMPFVVGKKVGAPDGSTVVFSLTGPLPRDGRRRGGSTAGRALLDDVPADPDGARSR